MTGRSHVWIAPPFDGPPTGGTIYNDRLVKALVARGVFCERTSVDGASVLLEAGGPGVYWIDSLHLDALPGLRAGNYGIR